MPSLEWNKNVWERSYDWVKEGDEWSGEWGSAATQWHWSLLPRIYPFVPTGTILEIAPGFGRWTQWLKDLCGDLILVDLSSKCIAACEERFQHCNHIQYHVNDGLSLAMVPDRAVDFAFSFDSLVHAELDVMESYLRQLREKLTPDGVAFLHHSNIGEYADRIAFLDRLPGKTLLERCHLIERNPHGRAVSVTAKEVARLAEDVGLRCLSQELVNWGSRRLIDCFSLFTLPGSKWAAASPRRLLNKCFMAEARRARRMLRHEIG